MNDSQNYPGWLIAGLISLTLLATGAGAVGAQPSHDGMSPQTHEPSRKLQPMAQPLWLKLAVSGVGAGLMGLELWWFVLSKPPVHPSND